MHPALRKLIVATLLTGGFAYFALVRDESSAEGLVVFDPRYEVPATADGGGAGEGAAAPNGLEVPAGGDDELPAAPASAPPPPPQLAHGRVLRFDGTPLEGVEVRRVHPYLEAYSEWTDEKGDFELQLESGRGELELADPEWITLGGRRVIEDRPQHEYLVVAAPRGRIQGRVTDANGAPLSDAMVRIVAPGDALVPFGIATPPLELDSWSTWTNAEGDFRFERAPWMPGVTVQADHPTARPASVIAVFEDGRAVVSLALAPLD